MYFFKLINEIWPTNYSISYNKLLCRKQMSEVSVRWERLILLYRSEFGYIANVVM